MMSTIDAHLARPTASPSPAVLPAYNQSCLQGSTRQAWDHRAEGAVMGAAILIVITLLVAMMFRLIRRTCRRTAYEVNPAPVPAEIPMMPLLPPPAPALVPEQAPLAQEEDIGKLDNLLLIRKILKKL